MKRKIHVVTVYGDKPPYHDSDGYYRDISHIANKLQIGTFVYPLFFNPRFNDPGDALMEIYSKSKMFARELARRLRESDRYKRVEVDSLELDKEEIDHMFSL